MSKELTPLEALEAFSELKRVYTDLFVDVGDLKDNLDIIETALKNYQDLKNKYDELETEYCDQQRSILKYDEEKRKKLKALEIIKDNLNVEEILFSAKGVCNSKDYDLLKEVLK